MRSQNPELMRKIRDFVEDYALDHGGETPSMRRIGDRFHISHVTVIRYLRSMDEMGLVIYRNGELTTEKLRKIQERETFSRNYLEGVSAGPGEYNEGAIDEYYTLPHVFTNGKKGKYFTLKVHGDSMRDAGISSEDVVICREQTEANEGDIVVAWVEGEGNTLKRLRRDKKGLFLWAENEDWKPENRNFGRKFTVQGVAFKILKDI